MKRNNDNQLELPILTDVSFVEKNSQTKNSAAISNTDIKGLDDNLRVAGKEDIEIYLSISNAYFKAISLQKK